MQNTKSGYFTKFERLLWLGSVALILASHFAVQSEDRLSLLAALIGVTALLYLAKGNPIGQVLVIIFSALYGYISYSFAYYGELLTYAGMTLPMAVFSLVAWLKNPYQGKKSEVQVAGLIPRDYYAMAIWAGLITFVFYFILEYFHTANLIPSTMSITTSFVAVYLSYKRSPLYALAYALNDIVLIALWLLASLENPSYSAVLACFVAFFCNDIYGYISWKRMEKRQLLGI